MYNEKLKAVGRGKEPPDLYDDLVFVWEAFVALSSSRFNYGLPEPIQFSEIESYLNLSGISNLERRQEVAHLVRVMDIEYISFLTKKNKRNK